MFQWDVVRPNTREGGQNVLKTFNVTGGRHEHRPNYRSFYFMSLDLFSLTFKNIFLVVLRQRSPPPSPAYGSATESVRHYTYTRLGLISMTVGHTSHLSLYSLSLGLLYCIHRGVHSAESLGQRNSVEWMTGGLYCHSVSGNQSYCVLLIRSECKKTAVDSVRDRDVYY